NRGDFRPRRGISREFSSTFRRFYLSACITARGLRIRVPSTSYPAWWCDNACRFRWQSDAASFARLLTQVRYLIACIMNCHSLFWQYCCLSGCCSSETEGPVFAAEVLEPRHCAVSAAQSDFHELTPIYAPANVKTSCGCRKT